MLERWSSRRKILPAVVRNGQCRQGGLEEHGVVKDLLRIGRELVV